MKKSCCPYKAHTDSMPVQARRLRAQLTRRTSLRGLLGRALVGRAAPIDPSASLDPNLGIRLDLTCPPHLPGDLAYTAHVPYGQPAAALLGGSARPGASDIAQRGGGHRAPRGARREECEWVERLAGHALVDPAACAARAARPSWAWRCSGKRRVGSHAPPRHQRRARPVVCRRQG